MIFFERQEKGIQGKELRHGYHPRQAPQTLLEKTSSKTLEEKENNQDCIRDKGLQHHFEQSKLHLDLNLIQVKSVAWDSAITSELENLLLLKTTSFLAFQMNQTTLPVNASNNF